MTTLEDLKVKHKTVSLELQLLSDLYASSCLLPGSEEDVDSLQEILYRHSMLYTLLKQSRFEGNVTTDFNKTSNNISRRELDRMDKIRKLLKEVLSLCYQRC